MPRPGPAELPSSLDQRGRWPATVPTLLSRVPAPGPRVSNLLDGQRTDARSRFLSWLLGGRVAESLHGPTPRTMLKEGCRSFCRWDPQDLGCIVLWGSDQPTGSAPDLQVDGAKPVQREARAAAAPWPLLPHLSGHPCPQHTLPAQRRSDPGLGRSSTRKPHVLALMDLNMEGSRQHKPKATRARHKVGERRWPDRPAASTPGRGRGRCERPAACPQMPCVVLSADTDAREAPPRLPRCPPEQRAARARPRHLPCPRLLS